ncbi:hypothetical protein ACP275_10G026100 [Erythranthe tilingii]
MDEVEIRELLIEHVGHRCCWGSRPARTWHIHAVEDCNVYVGTLETFIVERETVTENVPDRLLPNAVDTKSEAPVLFTPRGESRTVIPESEECVRCPACASCGALGKKFCPTCNADKLFRELKVKCPVCNGSGVDGSDYVCKKCKFLGSIVQTCPTCENLGLIDCDTCLGLCYVRRRNVAVVRWETLVARKVIATRGGAFVPDNVFEKAKGLQLFSTQSRKCSPATFADSNFLNQFSSEIIAARAPLSATAKTIRERHNISVIPITKVIMTNVHRSFSFYIVGTGKQVYFKDSYPSRFCWGLCSCFDWLNL